MDQISKLPGIIRAEFLSSYTKVIDNLFIGNLISALDNDFITKNNIRLILSFSSTIIQKKNPNVFMHIQYNIDDDTFQDMLSLFDNITFLIHMGILNGNGVLVHCEMGISRSSTMIIAYLMKYKNMSFGDAYAFLKEKRSIIQPNNGFILQLKLYEILGKNLLGTTRQHKELIKYLIPENNGIINFDMEKYYNDSMILLSCTDTFTNENKSNGNSNLILNEYRKERKIIPYMPNYYSLKQRKIIQFQ